jgi:predicted outer membrane repeat protein
VGLAPGAGTIANCTIVNNTQKYAGALLIQDTTVVSGCRFIANHTEQLGGAVSVSLPPNENATLQNCFFAGNTAQVGGGLHSPGNTNVINCVFTGNNSTLDGGAIHFSGFSPRILEDCTIAGNVASWWGGGIHRDATVGVSVRNTILWGNTDAAGNGEPSQYHNGVGSGPIRFCTVQGWTGVLGDDTNSGIDPQFVDADGPDNIAGTEDDNLRLITGSSSINRGEPSMPPLHLVDIDGNPRVQECIVDIGAYEAADADPLLPDCNGNGVQDACDIVALVSVDCNRNVVPDDCDIAGGFSSDLDANGIPDDCQGVPSNDNCSASKLVPTGPSDVTNLFATTDGPAGQVGCGFSGGGGDDQIHNDVWYRFVAQCGGIVTINLCNVNFDARVGVYFGCPSEGTQPIACSDNDCGSAPRVSFLAPTPLVYRIRVGGAPGAGGIGGGSMVITCTPSAQCPGDANGDGNVNISDLLLVITNWGQSGLNPADVNGDSVVNVSDLLGVIAAWGPCV